MTKGLLSENERKLLVVENPTIPQFSCLPKIHKEGNKIRPVVSDIKSPSSKISQWLMRKFKKYKNFHTLSVKNSFEVESFFDGLKISEDEILVSFDVEALYPSVPVDEAFEAMKGWISEQDISDDEAELVSKLTEIVLGQNWLQFDGKIYKQLSGLPIGNPLSSPLAEIFMSKLEMGISSKRWFPRVWRRYVDDVIAVVKEECVEELLNNLNKVHPAIKFTCEREKNSEIPFLDIKLVRELERITIDIYRKPTDKPLCIPEDSNHHINHKLAAFESSFFRLWNLPLNDERRKVERNYLINMAKINGYNTDDIYQINEKHKTRCLMKNFTTLKRDSKKVKKEISTKNGKTIMRHAILPYDRKIVGPIANVLKKNQINVCYNNRRTLGNIFGKLKTKKSQKEMSGIYRIPCNDCEMEYRGQTRRRLETREKEHERAIKAIEVDKSSVAKHMCENRHRKGEIEIIRQVDNPWELDGYESLYIATGKSLMNEGEPPLRSILFKFAIDKEKK